MNKLIIVGSAPSAIQIKTKDLSEFDVICLNNAWFLVPIPSINMWHHSTDFYNLAMHVPTDEQRRELELKSREWACKNLVDRIFFFDTPKNMSTVFLDIMSPVLQTIERLVRWNELHFVGCDFDYSGETSHFYGNSIKMTKNTEDLLKHNCPEASGVAADPLRFGKEWMNQHLLKMFTALKEYGVNISISSDRGLLIDAYKEVANA